MSTPDPRRGDEPGEPITPAPARREEDEQPAHDGVSPAVDDAADDPDAVPRGQHGPTLDVGNE